MFCFQNPSHGPYWIIDPQWNSLLLGCLLRFSQRSNVNLVCSPDSIFWPPKCVWMHFSKGWSPWDDLGEGLEGETALLVLAALHLPWREYSHPASQTELFCQQPGPGANGDKGRRVKNLGSYLARSLPWGPHSALDDEWEYRVGSDRHLSEKQDAIIIKVWIPVKPMPLYLRLTIKWTLDCSFLLSLRKCWYFWQKLSYLSRMDKFTHCLDVIIWLV